MNVYELADQFRAELLAGDRAAATRMVRSYADVWISIKRGLTQLKVIEKQARREVEQGSLPARQVLKAVLDQDPRYRELMQQVEGEIRTWAGMASDDITAQQAKAVAAAIEHTQQIAVASIGQTESAALGIGQTWNRVPAEAVRNLVGYMGDGTPLSKVLLDFAPEAAGKVERQLLVGISKGFNPRKIASRIRRDLGDGLDRALTIARTETLRAYRQAAIESYQANDDVIAEWMWHAHLGPRTCAACIAMHGKRFPVTVEFGSHPNCRCAPVPVTKTFEELAADAGLDPVAFGGIAEVEYGPTGEQWLEKQPAAAQRQILGAKYDAWAEGKIGLNDVVGYRNDPEWGPTRWERSAKSLNLRAA